MKKIILLMLMGMMLALLSGCGAQSAATEGGKAREIAIGIMPDVDSIPFLIAAENGYFKEEGLTVHLNSFKSAMDRDSALQSGNLDGAVSDMLAVAFAKSGGFDVKITSLTSGSYKLIAGKNERATSPMDLEGRAVAVSKNTIIEYAADRILAESGLGEAAVEKVVVGQIAARLEMLESGKLAAAVLPEPMASIAIKGGGKLVGSSDRLGIQPGVMMFTNQALKDKPEEIKAMYRAYNKAVEYLRKEPQSSYIDLLIKKGGFPPSIAGALVLPDYKAAERPARVDIDSAMRWLNEKNLVKQTYAYQDLVDDQFTQAAP